MRVTFCNAISVCAKANNHATNNTTEFVRAPLGLTLDPKIISQVRLLGRTSALWADIAFVSGTTTYSSG